MTHHMLNASPREAAALHKGTATAVVRRMELADFIRSGREPYDWQFFDKEGFHIDCTTEILLNEYCPYGRVGDVISIDGRDYVIASISVIRVAEMTEEQAMATGANVDLLADLLRPLEAKSKVKPSHWVYGDNSCGSYCHPCASKVVKEIKAKRTPADESDVFVDGGWCEEEDGQKWCDRCGVMLESSYTDYGVEDELEGLEERGINNLQDAWIAARTIGLRGNPLLTKSCGDWEYKPEWKGRIAKLCVRFLYESRHGEGSWATDFAWYIGLGRAEG